MSAEPGLRRFGALRMLRHLALGFALVPAWLLANDVRRRRGLERRFFARLLRAVGVHAVVRGVPATATGTLFVANHVSFTDVVALAHTLDATFVAKADLRGWPVLGPLATRFGTLFVNRDGPLSAAAQARSIAARLAAGGSVVLFAEGTTSDGRDVLPFRSALLAAGAAATIVQPVALRYADGARRAYIGDESLAANLLRLAPHQARLDLLFLDPLPREVLADRKVLAEAARAAIIAALATPRAPSSRTTPRRSSRS